MMQHLGLNFNLAFFNVFVKCSPTAISLSSVGASNLLSNLQEGLL